MVGTGGFYAANREFNRVRKEMDRYLENRLQRQQARLHRYTRANYATGEPTLERRFGFPCFHLCSQCNYLSHESDAACPSCGETEWLDLSRANVTERLADIEERQRHVVPRWVRIAVVGVLLLIWSIVFLAVESLIVLAGVPVLAVAYRLLIRPLSVLFLRLKDPPPRRWRLPAPSPEPGQAPATTITGVVEGASGDVLTAPFSGRACVAYQAEILFDVAGDARPPEWALQEASSVDFTVGGQTIPADRALVRGRLEPVTEPGPEFELRRFLLQRGLRPDDGDYWLFESVLTNGSRAKAEVFEKNLAFVTTSGRTEAAPRPSTDTAPARDTHGSPEAAVADAPSPGPAAVEEEPDFDVSAAEQSFWQRTWSLFAPSVALGDWLWYRRALITGYFFVVGYLILILGLPYLADGGSMPYHLRGCPSLLEWLGYVFGLAVVSLMAIVWVAYLPLAALVTALAIRFQPQDTRVRATLLWVTCAISTLLAGSLVLAPWVASCL